MNTPTDAPPAPTVSGVWLPVALAQKVLHCYYGEGPRVDGSTRQSETPSRHPFPVAGQTDSFVTPTIEQRHGLHPQGAARRPEKPA